MDVFYAVSPAVQIKYSKHGIYHAKQIPLPDLAEGFVLFAPNGR